MEKKEIKKYSYWTRLTSLGMAVIFFYVQVAYGVIEPSSKLWEERRKAAEELKRGNHKGTQTSNQTRSNSEENQILLAKVPAPESDKGLVAQLPSLELNILSQQVPQKLGSGILGLGSQRENLQSNNARLQSEIKWLETIPASFANLKELYLPSQWKPQDLMVVHIQDVHENYEAQKNIARIIQALSKPETQSSLQSASPNPQVQLVVGLEGANGSFAFDSYRSLPEKEHVKKIAEYFLKESLISGAEYVGMTLDSKNSKEPPILFWGLENEKLYLEHVRAFKDSIPQEKEAKKIVLDLENSLNQLKNKILNQDLKELDQNMTLHHQGQIKLSQYLKVLTQDGIPSDSEMIRKFMNALNLEETLNYEQVEKERRALTNSLVEKLPKSELNNLVSSSLSYRLGNISYGAFYQYLKDLCQAYGVSLSKFPEMDKYVRYVLIADKIKSEELFSEVEILEKRRIKSFIVTAQEKEIVECSKDLVLMEKMVGYRFSPEDWKEYLSRKNEILEVSQRMKKLENYFGQAENFSKRAISMVTPEIVVDPSIAGKKKKEKSSSTEEPQEKSVLVKALKPFERFNAAAIKRDKALVDNLLHQARVKRNIQTMNLAILISGGFHTEGMTDLLRQRNIAYAVLTPRLGKVEGTGTDYLEIFRRDKTPLEKLFTGERITLKSEMGTASSSMNETLPIVGLINRSLINLYAMLTIFSAAKSVTNLTPEQKDDSAESIEETFEKRLRTVDRVKIDGIETRGEGRKLEGVGAGIEIFGKINDKRSDVSFWSELLRDSFKNKKITDTKGEPEEIVLDDFVNRLYPRDPGFTNQFLYALNDTLKSAFDSARNTFSNIDAMLAGVGTPSSLPQDLSQKGEIIDLADRNRRSNKLKAASIPDAFLKWALDQSFKNKDSFIYKWLVSKLSKEVQSLIYIGIYGFFTAILIPLGETHGLAYLLTTLFGGNVFLAAAVMAFVFPLLHTDLLALIFKWIKGDKFSWREFAALFALRFVGGGVFTLLLALPSGLEISFALHMLWNSASVIGHITGLWKILPFAIYSPKMRVSTLLSSQNQMATVAQELGIDSSEKLEGRKQEDRFINAQIIIPGLAQHGSGQLMAVMDGHGGARAANEIQKALVKSFIKFLKKNNGDIKVTLENVVKELTAKTKNYASGSTLSLVYVPEDENRAFVAVIGDSPVIIVDKDQGNRHSPDHNIQTNPSELDKLMVATKGEPINYDGNYIWDNEGKVGLQLSRSLGDKRLNGILNRTPEIYDVELGRDSVILLASDGILGPKARNVQLDSMVKTIQDGGDANSVAQRALKRDIRNFEENRIAGDNITVIVWKAPKERFKGVVSQPARPSKPSLVKTFEDPALLEELLEEELIKSEEGFLTEMLGGPSTLLKKVSKYKEEFWIKVGDTKLKFSVKRSGSEDIIVVDEYRWVMNEETQKKELKKERIKFPGSIQRLPGKERLGKNIIIGGTKDRYETGKVKLSGDYTIQDEKISWNHMGVNISLDKGQWIFSVVMGNADYSSISIAWKEPPDLKTKPLEQVKTVSAQESLKLLQVRLSNMDSHAFPYKGPIRLKLGRRGLTETHDFFIVHYFDLDDQQKGLVNYFGSKSNGYFLVDYYHSLIGIRPLKEEESFIIGSSGMETIFPSPNEENPDSHKMIFFSKAVTRSHLRVTVTKDIYGTDQIVLENLDAEDQGSYTIANPETKTKRNIISVTASLLDPIAKMFFDENSWQYKFYTGLVAPLWETIFLAFLVSHLSLLPMIALFPVLHIDFIIDLILYLKGAIKEKKLTWNKIAFRILTRLFVRLAGGIAIILPLYIGQGPRFLTSTSSMEDLFKSGLFWSGAAHALLNHVMILVKERKFKFAEFLSPLSMVPPGEKKTKVKFGGILRSKVQETIGYTLEEINWLYNLLVKWRLKKLISETEVLVREVEGSILEVRKLLQLITRMVQIEPSAIILDKSQEKIDTYKKQTISSWKELINGGAITSVELEAFKKPVDKDLNQMLADLKKKQAELKELARAIELDKNKDEPWVTRWISSLSPEFQAYAQKLNIFSFRLKWWAEILDGSRVRSRIYLISLREMNKKKDEDIKSKIQEEIVLKGTDFKPGWINDPEKALQSIRDQLSMPVLLRVHKRTDQLEYFDPITKQWADLKELRVKIENIESVLMQEQIADAFKISEAAQKKIVKEWEEAVLSDGKKIAKGAEGISTQRPRAKPSSFAKKGAKKGVKAKKVKTVAQRTQTVLDWIGEPRAVMPGIETVVYQLGLYQAMHLGLGWTALVFAFTHLIIKWIIRSKEHGKDYHFLDNFSPKVLAKDILDLAIHFVLSLVFTLPFTGSLDTLYAALLSLAIHSFYNDRVLWAKSKVENLSLRGKKAPPYLKILYQLPLASVLAVTQDSVKASGISLAASHLKDALTSQRNGQEIHRQILRNTHIDEMEYVHSVIGDVDMISLINHILGRPSIGNAGGHSQSPDMLFTNMELSSFQELRMLLAKEAVKLGAEIIYAGDGGDEFNIVFKGDSSYVKQQMKELASRVKNHFTNRYSVFTLGVESLNKYQIKDQIRELENIGVPFTLVRYGSELTLLLDRKGISEQELKDSLQTVMTKKGLQGIGYEQITYEDVEPGFFTVSMGAASYKDSLDYILQQTGHKQSDWIDEDGYVREERLEELLVWNSRFANDLLKGAKEKGRNTVLVAADLDELQAAVMVYGKPVTLAKMEETRDNIMARERGEIDDGTDHLTGHFTLDGLKNQMAEYKNKNHREYAHVYVFGILNYKGKNPAKRAFHTLQEEKEIGYFKGNEVIQSFSGNISEEIELDEENLTAMGRVGPDTKILASEKNIRGPPENPDQKIKTIFGKFRKKIVYISGKEREILGIVYDLPTEEIEKLKDPEILKEIEPQFRDLFLHKGQFGIINIIQEILEVFSTVDIEQLKDVLELVTHDVDENTRVMVVQFRAQNIHKLLKLYRKAQDQLRLRAIQEMREKRAQMHANVERERRKSVETTPSLPILPKPFGVISAQLSKLSGFWTKVINVFIGSAARAALADFDNKIEASQRKIARDAVGTIAEVLSQDMKSLGASNVKDLKDHLKNLMILRKDNSLFKSDEALKEARKQSIDQAISMLLADFETIIKLEQVAGNEEKRKQAALLIMSIFHLLILQDEADLKLPYVPHSIKHSLNVRREVENIISRSPRIRTALEGSYGTIGEPLALLSAWLHDIGYGILTQAMEEANQIAKNNGVNGYMAGKGYHTDLGVTLAEVPLTGGMVGPTLFSQLDALFELSHMGPNASEGSKNALDDLKLVIKDHGADHEEHEKDGPLGSGVHQYRPASMEHDLLNFLARLADNLDAEAHNRLYAYHNNPFFLALLRRMSEEGQASVVDIKERFLAGQETAIRSYALHLQLTQGLLETEALKKSQDHFDFILDNISSFDESNFPHFAGMIKSQRVMERDGRLVVQVVLNDSNRLIPSEVQDYQLVRMQKAYESLSFNGQEIIVEKLYSEKSRKENEQENKNRIYIEKLTLLKNQQKDANQKRILEAIIHYLVRNPTVDLIEGHEGEPLLFENGENIVSTEEEGSLPVYILVEGKVVGSVGRDEGVEQGFTLGSGDIFGEMAHITGKRTANIYAQGLVEAYRIRGEKFRELFMDPEFLVAYAEVVDARTKSQARFEGRIKESAKTTQALTFVGKGMIQGLAMPLRFALSKLGLRFSDTLFENVIMPIVEELIFTAIPLLFFAFTGPIGLLVFRSIFVFLHIFGQPDMNLWQKLTIPFVVSLISVVSYLAMPGLIDILQFSNEQFNLPAMIAGSMVGHIAGNFFVDWVKSVSRGKIVLGKAILPQGQAQSGRVPDITVAQATAKQIMQDLKARGVRFSGHDAKAKMDRLEKILMQLELYGNNWYWNFLNASNKVVIAERIAGAIDIVYEMVSKNAGNLNLSKRTTKIVVYGSFIWGEEATPPTDFDLLIIDPESKAGIKKFELTEEDTNFTAVSRMLKAGKRAAYPHGFMVPLSKLSNMNRSKDEEPEAVSDEEIEALSVPMSAFGSGILIYGEWDEMMNQTPSYKHYLDRVHYLLGNAKSHLNLGNKRKVIRRLMEALTVLRHSIDREHERGNLSDAEYHAIFQYFGNFLEPFLTKEERRYSINHIPETVNENFSRELNELLEEIDVERIVTNTTSVLETLRVVLDLREVTNEGIEDIITTLTASGTYKIVYKALGFLSLLTKRLGLESLGLRLPDVSKRSPAIDRWIEQKFARWWESPEFMLISLPWNQAGREKFLAKHENKGQLQLDIRSLGIKRIVEATQKAFMAGVVGGLMVAVVFVIPFFSPQVMDINIWIHFSLKVAGAIFVAGLVPGYITNIIEHGRFNLENPLNPLTAGTAVFHERLNIVTRPPQMSGDQRHDGRDLPPGLIQLVEQKGEEKEAVARMARDQVQLGFGWKEAVNQFVGGSVQSAEAKAGSSELDKFIEKHSAILLIGSLVIAGVGLIVSFFNVWIGVPLVTISGSIAFATYARSFTLQEQKKVLAQKKALKDDIQDRQKALRDFYRANPIIAQIIQYIQEAKREGYAHGLPANIEQRLRKSTIRGNENNGVILDENENMIGSYVRRDGKLIPLFPSLKQQGSPLLYNWDEGSIIAAIASNMASKGWPEEKIKEVSQSTIQGQKIINREGEPIGYFQYKNGRFIPVIFGFYVPPLQTDRLIKKVLAARGLTTSRLALAPGAWGLWDGVRFFGIEGNNRPSFLTIGILEDVFMIFTGVLLLTQFGLMPAVSPSDLLGTVHFIQSLVGSPLIMLAGIFLFHLLTGVLKPMALQPATVPSSERVSRDLGMVISATNTAKTSAIAIFLIGFSRLVTTDPGIYLLIVLSITAVAGLIHGFKNLNIEAAYKLREKARIRAIKKGVWGKDQQASRRNWEKSLNILDHFISPEYLQKMPPEFRTLHLAEIKRVVTSIANIRILGLERAIAPDEVEGGDILNQILGIFWTLELRVLAEHRGANIALEQVIKIAEEAAKLRINSNTRDFFYIHFTQQISYDPLVLIALRARENIIESFNSYLRILNPQHPYRNSKWYFYYHYTGKDKEPEHQAVVAAINAINQVDPLLKPEHIAQILNLVEQHPNLMKEDNFHKLSYEALRGIAITMRYPASSEIGSLSYGPKELVQNFASRISGLVPSERAFTQDAMQQAEQESAYPNFLAMVALSQQLPYSSLTASVDTSLVQALVVQAHSQPGDSTAKSLSDQHKEQLRLTNDFIEHLNGYLDQQLNPFNAAEIKEKILQELTLESILQKGSSRQNLNLAELLQERILKLVQNITNLKGTFNYDEIFILLTLVYAPSLKSLVGDIYNGLEEDSPLKSLGTLGFGIVTIFNRLEKAVAEKEAQGLGLMVNPRGKVDLAGIFERALKGELEKEARAIARAGQSSGQTPFRTQVNGAQGRLQPASKPVLAKALDRFRELQAGENRLNVAEVLHKELEGLIEILVELGNSDQYEAELLPVLRLIKSDARFENLSEREKFEALKEIAAKKRDLVVEGKLILAKKGPRESEPLVTKFNRWIGEWHESKLKESQAQVAAQSRGAAKYQAQKAAKGKVKSVTFAPLTMPGTSVQPKVKDILEKISRTLLNSNSKYFNFYFVALFEDIENPEEKVILLKELIQPYLLPIIAFKGDINQLSEEERFNYSVELVNIVNLVPFILQHSENSGLTADAYKKRNPVILKAHVLEALTIIKDLGESLDTAIKQGNEHFRVAKLPNLGEIKVPNKNLKASLNLWRFYQETIAANYLTPKAPVQATQPQTYKAVEKVFGYFGIKVPPFWWVTSSFLSGFIESNQTLPAMLSENAADQFISGHPTIAERIWLETTLKFMKIATLVGLGVGFSLSAHLFGFSGSGAIVKVIFTTSLTAYLFHAASHSLRNAQERFGAGIALGFSAILAALFTAGSGYALSLTGGELVGLVLMAAGWPVAIVVSAILVLAAILGSRKVEAPQPVEIAPLPLPVVPQVPSPKEPIKEGIGVKVSPVKPVVPGLNVGSQGNRTAEEIRAEVLARNREFQRQQAAERIGIFVEAKNIAEKFNEVWFKNKVGQEVELRALLKMLEELKEDKPSVRLIGKKYIQNVKLKELAVDPILISKNKNAVIEELKVLIAKEAALQAIRDLVEVPKEEGVVVKILNELKSGLEPSETMTRDYSELEKLSLIVEIANKIKGFKSKTKMKLFVSQGKALGIFTTFLKELNLDRKLPLPTPRAQSPVLGRAQRATTGSLRAGLATGTLPETYLAGREFFKNRLGWENAPNWAINLFFAGAYESLKSFRPFRFLEEHQEKLELTPFQKTQLGITFVLVSVAMLGTAIGIPFGLDFLSSGGSLKYFYIDLAGSLAGIVTYSLGLRLSYAEDRKVKVSDLEKRLTLILAFPMILMGAIIHGLFNLLSLIINYVMDDIELAFDFYKPEKALSKEYQKAAVHVKEEEPRLIQPLSQIEEEYNALLTNNQNPDKRKLFLRSLKVLALAAVLGVTSAQSMPNDPAIDSASLPRVIGHLTAQELAGQISSLGDYKKLLEGAKKEEQKDSFEVEIVSLLMHGGEAEELNIQVDGMGISFNDLYATLEQTFPTYKISQKAALKIWNLGRRQAQINSSSRIHAIEEMEQLPNIPSDSSKIPGELFYGSGLSGNGYVNLANKIRRIHVEEGKKNQAHFLLVETREELETLKVHGISPALLAAKGVHLIVREEEEKLKGVKSSTIDLDLLLEVIRKLDNKVGSLDIYTEKMVFKKGKRKELQIRILKIVSQTQVIEVTSDLELFAKAKQLLSKQQ